MNVRSAVTCACVATPLLAGGLPLLAAAPGAAGPRVDFVRDVRPVLSRACLACHGPDDKTRAAGLRLDVREAALRSAGRPAAIVPGKPDAGTLLRRVTAADRSGRMPPPHAGPRLDPAQVAILRRWIQEGAEYRQHWAFVSPTRPPLPRVKQPRWSRNGIDRFIQARLEGAGLAPGPEADRFTLLRRASLDLRGLPPSPQEVAEFARDDRPDAYERAVDRFLADPGFGERWARPWLDLARYADSAGYGSDPLRTIWRYRDWVVDAFNRNLPYDQFTIEQLAGDLLPNPTPEQKIATAFHRNTMTNTEGGTDDEEFRMAAVKDRVDTTLQVWMGVTIGCAKCHSHKYDPFSQVEYYRLFAFFNQTADADRPDEAPVLPVSYGPFEAENERLTREIGAIRARLATVPEAEKKPLMDRIAALERQRQSATVPVMEELPPDKRRPTHVLVKANFLQKGDAVTAGVPAALNPMPPGAPADRLGLARWLVAPENPLTARVAVNRFWAQLFGAGLVETEEDFGTQGELPSHPELLDWLAVTYASQPGAGTKSDAQQGLGWDTKALLRLMVTSATYRQTSRATPDRIKRDPRNRLLSRFPRVRLEAELVRDQALALAGLLSRKMHGPSVYPPQPAGLWQAAFNGQRTWPTSTGEDRYRRGLYTFWRRTVPYPSMATFDAPSREFCTIRRSRTNTPLQAFVTLNDPVFVEAAQALGRRLVREGGESTAERVRHGLRLCLGLPPGVEPDPARVAALVALFESEAGHFRSRPKEAEALATDPLGPLPAGLDAASAAAWTVVANVLLNLDAVLTRG